MEWALRAPSFLEDLGGQVCALQLPETPCIRSHAVPASPKPAALCVQPLPASFLLLPWPLYFPLSVSGKFMMNLKPLGPSPPLRILHLTRSTVSLVLHTVTGPQVLSMTLWAPSGPIIPLISEQCRVIAPAPSEKFAFITYKSHSCSISLNFACFSHVYV